MSAIFVFAIYDFLLTMFLYYKLVDHYKIYRAQKEHLHRRRIKPPLNKSSTERVAEFLEDDCFIPAISFVCAEDIQMFA